MTSKKVLEKISSLELNEDLTGIIDERGKYIYITKKEMESVLNYIKSKGRVSRADLLIECNKLIKLDPSAKDKQLI